MVELDLHWAREIARVLKSRGIRDSGSERSSSVMALLEALTSEPPVTSWRQVVYRWKPETTRQRLRDEAIRQRAHRIREILTRAHAGLHTEYLRGSSMFRHRTRVMNEITAAQLLHDEGSVVAARTGFVHALELSKRSELIDCAIAAAQSIRAIDAAQSTRNGLREIDEQIQLLQELSGIEREAIRLRDHARALLNEFSRDRKRTLRQLAEITAQLQQLDTGQIIAVRFIGFRVSLWTASLRADTETMMRIGRAAIDLMNEYPHLESEGARAEFHGTRLSAALITKNAKQARLVWNELSDSFTIGGANWTILLQIYFLVCTTSGDYDQARDALWDYEAQRHGSEPDRRRRLWLLYRAYLLFMIDHGVVYEGPFTGAPRPYLAVLERQLGPLAQDKAIGGAGLLILRVLHHLRGGRYAEVVTRTEQLREYSARYLRNPNTLRTGIFLRCLAALPTAKFDATEAQRRAELIRSRTSAYSTVRRDDAEIVRYEDLWRIVIELLER